MSNNTNQPPSSPTQYSSSLSLSLAGIFRRAEAEAEEGRGRRGVDVVDAAAAAVEISSENSGLVGRSSTTRSSEDWFDDHHDVDVAEEGDGGDDGKSERKKKKRKKYQRHTAEQIREMEAVFKHTPHPDEKQREQLSKQLGLSQRQVKFWFQNRRTQIKAFQERHESSIQKLELDKLREENKAMRETMSKACCPNCSMATTSTTATPSYSEVHRLRLENAKLRAEIEKLGSVLKGKTTTTTTTSTTSPSSSTCNEETENIRGLESYSGIQRVDEKGRIMKRVKEAMEEVIKMGTMGEPLWVHSVERGREILNYDEYLKQFSVQNNERPKRLSNVEASRAIGDVPLDLPSLLQIFLDVNKWKEMFPCLISKAATLDVICSGEGANRNGAVQLMYLEVQMMTPMVGRREVYFVRYCKKINEQDWGIVDVSILDPKTQQSDLKYCIKRPSGCILHPYSTGRCKVIWVEHVECEKSRVPTLYRTIVNSGVAFGANHWLATLQLQCQRLVFFMATNVPIQDSTGGVTVAGRKSILKLGQRMTESFCQAVGGCSSLNNNSWSKFRNDKGEEIWIRSRKNMNDPGQPLGLILCAVSSFWLPLSPNLLFAFLTDQTRRSQWDMMMGDGSMQSIASLAKGQDRGNAVTIQEVKSKDSSSSSRWIVQDSSRNAYESMVVYAPVDFILMQSVITGCDSSNLPILPSGFSILPDGHGEIRPLLITSNHQEKNTTEEEEGGSLITMAFQVLVSTSFDATLTKESVESVNNVISCTLTNIRKNLHCEDG